MASIWLMVAVTIAATILAAMDSHGRPGGARRRLTDGDQDDRRDLRARADAIITYLTATPSDRPRAL